MNRILLFLLLITCSYCAAQNYTYLGVEDGLSNRKVYSIQKDKRGYMWFLTHGGIDRFDGKQFKHYKLKIDSRDVNSFINFNQLHIDTVSNIWEVGRAGELFKYDHFSDEFQLINILKTDKQDKDNTFHYAYIDDNNNIWLCTAQKQYIYNIDSNQEILLNSNLNEEVSNIIQIDKETYCIGTSQGVHIGTLKDNTLQIVKKQSLDSLEVQVGSLFYSKKLHKIIIGSFLKGVFIYDISKNNVKQLKELEDVNINCIKALNEDELLIGTDGAGVYKMDLSTDQLIPYITADYNHPNLMNGNNINDIYVEGNKRIWMANYPIGITIFNRHFPAYKWIKHAIGNKNSLINDQVNAVIEDEDGDLWFATNNGISNYNVQKDTWTNLLSSFHSDARNKNHIFMSICEIMPGIILAGGYTSGMYWIEKKTMKANYFVPSSFKANAKTDKYIRSIYKDSQERIWIGGFYDLKYIDIKQHKIEFFSKIRHINNIIEEDSNHMWIGNTNGLYLLNIKTKKIDQIKLPVKSFFVNNIHRGADGTIYIGTSGDGLIIYNPKTKEFINYRKENSALISNSIYTIFSDKKGNLILSTENSITRFYLKEKTFHNWTKEQGLMTTHFNMNSGTSTSRNTIVIGSGDGAIEFKLDTYLPEYNEGKLIFSDFRLFYQTIHPGEKNSPLTEDINDTKKIYLSHDQNIFSLRLSTINYDYPSQAMYSWKLDGFYNEWNKPSSENIIRYTNLDPGNYRLHVRAISSEDYQILEERSINIIIAPPFWKTPWAMILYGILIILVIGTILRYFFMKKEKEISSEKVSFFINAAHDIRTPLTLVKAPLNDILEKEELSPDGEANLLTAIRSTNNLFRIINNLINFEKTSDSTIKLRIAEYELYSFIEEIIQQFKSFAEAKQIQLTFESNFRFLNVWFDKTKMDSILRNLISNALKYTPEMGSVSITAFSNPQYWSIEIKDTGIGIPADEQKKLFRMFFRGSNAVNLKTSGSGIGLLLVKRLVKKHKGRIIIKSVLNEGSSFLVTFRHGHKHFRQDLLSLPEQTSLAITDNRLYAPSKNSSDDTLPPPSSNTAKILIVEDNDELKSYLKRSLTERYTVHLASNGEEGLIMAKNIMPNLIISDIMMPRMRGDEMCVALKSDIETSHIPIILLTALSDRENIINGLAIKADEYMTKPFDIGILKANIANLLANRALLIQQYAHLDLKEPETNNYSSELDYKFMSKVKEEIEKNIDNSDFSVEKLSSALNMSRTSFYNKIKALTTQAPADFIRTQRMNRAGELLKAKKYSINEVAFMVGFNDTKYFREVFKKYFNMTPSKYIGKDEEDE